MKLKYCYVENFGVLNQKEFSFVNGINTIYQDNGTGKTTLAVFIKSMFYGLTGKTIKTGSVETNERRMYYPWNNGKFGGYLEFSVQGEDYKITRFFGKKESEDTFEIINLKTGKSELKYTSSEIGMQLFGISAIGFEKTVFTPQYDVKTTDGQKSLTKELSNVIEDVSNQANYIKAEEYLRKKISDVGKPNGTLKQLQASLSEKESRIQKLKLEKNNLNELNQLHKNIIAKLEVEEKNLLNLKANQKALINEKISDVYDANIKKLNDLTIKLNDAEKLFEQQKFDETMHNKMQQKLNDYDYNTVIIAQKNSMHNEIKTNYAYSSFVDSDLTLNTIDLMTKQATSKLYEKSNSKKPSFNKVLSGGVVAILLSIIAIALSLGGVFANNQVKNIVYIVFTLIGILGISAIVLNKAILKFLYKNKEFQATSNLSDNSISEKDIVDTLKKYNCWNEDMFLSLSNLKSRFTLYLEKKNEYNVISEEIKNISFLNSTIFDEVVDYLNGFGIVVDNLQLAKIKLTELNNAYAQINNLKNEIEEINASIKELDYSPIIESVENVNIGSVDKSNIDSLVNSAETLVSNLKEEKLELQARIQQLNYTLDDYPVLVTEHMQLLDEIENEKYKLTVFQKTKQYLEMAKDEIISTYLSPMKSRFEKYYNEIVSSGVDKFSIDTDLNLSIEKYGENKELAYFSKGYQEVFNIIMRLSLLDEVFAGNTTPFIVLDDPFANVDDEKLERTKKLLTVLANKHQILYFTCHSSRVIK